MPRKGNVTKREVLTDPIYSSATIENDSGESCEVEFAFAYNDVQ